MRFVGVLAIEGEAQSAENADFRGFLLFPATARAVSGLKFRNAARFYPKKLPYLRTPIRAEAAGWGQKSHAFDPRVGISAAALVASNAAAFAAPALVLSDVNMRVGPGTNSPVVITVPDGSTVDVQGCDASGWGWRRW